jgi:hypothetical protein
MTKITETILKWLRANLVLLIFAGMLLLQFLTWREVARLRYDYEPSCGDRYACSVALSNADRSYLDDILKALRNK